MIPIESGVQQGSSKSGMLFVFLLSHLRILLKNTQAISPLTITTPNINKNITTNLNNIMGYSDDLTIDGVVDIKDDGTCTQVELINNTLDKFAGFSGLTRNNLKSQIYSFQNTNKLIHSVLSMECRM